MIHIFRNRLKLAGLTASLFAAIAALGQQPGQPAAGGPPPAGPGRGGGGAPMPAYNHNDHTGYTQIFNGKDLEGWDYAPDVFRIEGDEIVAGYNPAVNAGTTFISYMARPDLADFDLLVDIKSENGNTGVQFRSYRNDVTTPAGGPSATQQAQLAAIDRLTLPKSGAVVSARSALLNAAFAQPRNDADIGAKAGALAAAELDLANARATEVAKLQASTNKLNEQQMTALRTQIGRGGPLVAYAVWNVAGYQADFPAVGNIWEGGRFGAMYNGVRLNERGNLTTGGNITLADPAPDGRTHKVLAKLPTVDETGNPIFKPGDWNQYHIMARGNTLILFLNGRMISMTIDTNPVLRRDKGIIALQIEGGKHHFKNIWLKEAPIQPAVNAFVR